MQSTIQETRHYINKLEIIISAGFKMYYTSKEPLEQPTIADKNLSNFVQKIRQKKKKMSQDLYLELVMSFRNIEHTVPIGSAHTPAHLTAGRAQQCIATKF